MLVLLCIFAAIAVSEARVTFPYSEVLQVNDLVNKIAAFNCDNGCKVYVDRPDDTLIITQNGAYIASFSDIVGNNSYVPDGLELAASKTYKLQARNPNNADFVFYVVSRKAPNYGVSVLAPQATKGIAAAGTGRYFTVLSRFNAVEYYALSGAFPAGYPKIFTTGYDAIGDSKCSPVWQSRSQYNAEQSRPMIIAPIVTFDFGFNGKHSVSVQQTAGATPYKSSASSTVYMSPGFVGCSNIGQTYYSNLRGVQESFTFAVANGMDITARYNALATTEPVRFKVNKDTLDFYGTSSFKRSYGYGSLDVSLSWQRVTAASSWAIQLDFGTVAPPVQSTTKSGTTLTAARVTFPYSEVLQAPDIAGTNKANFKCKNICKVYVDRKSDKLMITQQGNLIAPFNTIVSGNSFMPTGVVLPAGDDYMLENRGEPNPQFVLYIVDSTAPNYDTPVYASQDTIGISAIMPSRYATILSSYEAEWFYGFNGQFSPGFPAIYTTGFDAADEKQCRPVYKAKSQYTADVSWATIPSAIFTVDFGYVGVHNVSVAQKKVNQPPKGSTTTVYTSPGYVGCSINQGQNYYSSLNSIEDKFTVAADFLDITSVYNGLAAGEPLQLTVNNKKQNLAGSGNFNDHYNGATFDVSLYWSRTTPGSSFAMQLDFGSVNQPTRGPEPGLSTTSKIGRSFAILPAVALVIAACL